MNNADKKIIINTWCKMFAIIPGEDRVLVLMDVDGFAYPLASYLTETDALDKSYTRAHAHTWTICKHIEAQREYDNANKHR